MGCSMHSLSYGYKSSEKSKRHGSSRNMKGNECYEYMP